MDLSHRIRQAEAPSGLETGSGALAGGDDDDGGGDRRTSGDGHARLFEPSLVLYRRRTLSEELFNDNYSSPRGKNNRRRTRSSQYQELTPLLTPLQGVANIKNGPLYNTRSSQYQERTPSLTPSPGAH